MSLFRRRPVGTVRLFSVGINAYDRSQLQGCVNDSNDLAAYLTPRGVEVRQLLDRDATAEHMEAFWREGVALTGAHDLLIIHYSGHGANGPSNSPDDPGQCLVSCDMRPFYAARMGTIVSQVHRYGQVLVILDCCHSERGSRNAPLGVAHLDGYRAAKSVPWAWLDDDQDPYLTRFGPRTAQLGRASTFPLVEFAACEAWDVTYDARINGRMNGCYTVAVLDSAKELDEKPSLVRRGYSVAMLQERIRTRLPSPDYPTKPPLQASPRQLRWRMWTPDQRA